MSIYVARQPTLKAGPLGPGAGVLMTEFPLMSVIGRRSPQEKMRRAWELGISVPWIRLAERAIDGACSTVDWHLEDQDDTEIDDEYVGRFQQEARMLIEKPSGSLPDDAGKKLTRRELWALTYRHMGLCGNAFWYLDQQNLYGIPAAIKYLRPDRMTPVEDKGGNLLAWTIDKTQYDPGITVPLTSIIQFVLEPPDFGHFGIGLVETALLKAQNSVGIDSHLQQVLGAGGRLSGLLGPKTGDTLNNDQYNQLVADARTITEQPNAAQRLQIVRGPVDFTPTTMTIKDLDFKEIMGITRDDILALWGVPLSQVASVSGNGLNSGESRKVERQAFWENANHPRIISFTETLQYQLLDKYMAVGVRVEMEIDEPTFEDDGPRFDLLQKSIDTPLRNWERRELIGKEPFGPTVLNELGVPLDDEIWLPSTQVRAFVAPEEGFAPAASLQVSAEDETGDVEANTANDRASNAAGETAQTPAQNTAPKPKPAPTAQKASLRSLHSVLVGLRTSLADRFTPRVKSDVATILDEQKRETIARARSQAAHLMENPKDVRGIWDEGKWNRRMTEAMKPHLIRVAEELTYGIRANMPPAHKAGPVTAVERTLTRGATRITGINKRTRDAVISVVRQTVDAGKAAGKSPAEVGDDLELAIEEAGMDGEGGIGLWDEYRAEMIARTEMTASYNDAALGSYEDLGVTEVEAIDGDDDAECAARDGQTFTLDEADAEAADEHPNGTLDFVPVLPDEEPPQKAAIAPMDQPHRVRLEVAHADAPTPIVNVAAPDFTPLIEMHAQQHQQHLAAIGDLRSAINNIPAPVVNVPAPIVNIPAPVVNLPPVPRRIVKTVVRDKSGKISGSIEEAMNQDD